MSGWPPVVVKALQVQLKLNCHQSSPPCVPIEASVTSESELEGQEKMSAENDTAGGAQAQS